MSCHQNNPAWPNESVERMPAGAASLQSRGRLAAAMVTASAPGLAIWLLGEMVPICALLVVGLFAAQASFGRTWLGLRKVTV